MAGSASIYLTGIYPIRLSPFDLRHYVLRSSPQALSGRLRKTLEGHPSITLKAVHPRVTDGGAIAEFEVSGDHQASADRIAELVRSSSAAIERPWWSWRAGGSAFLVKGTPWLEDLDHFPNRTIQIEFEQGPTLSQENLWHLIRPFGRIKSIESTPNPKITHVTMENIRSATIARNCLHGYKSSPDQPRLKILYLPSIKAHAFRSWITSHPRIVLPTLVLLLGGISYAFFDPIRTFFIQSHLSGTFDVHQYQLVNWIEKETRSRFTSFITPSQDEDDLGTSIVETERSQAIDQLRAWISSSPETFVVVSGPKGSGKNALVNQVIHSRKNVLRIDCEKICKDGLQDRTRVTVLAKEVGYFPYFGFLGNIGRIIDLGAVGVIGQKAGFESSIESEIRQVLDRAEVALSKISEEISRKRKRGTGIPVSNSAEDENFKEKDGSGLVMNGGYDEIPVVVLEGFYTKQASKDDYLWDELSDWASRLIEKKIAHVIFTSENVGIGKPLSKALSSRAMNLIHLTDASPDSALQYIARQMARPEDRMMILNPTNASLIAKLGGRLTELEKLVEKIRAGVALEVAVEEIVMRAVMEIKKRCVRDGESGSSDDGAKWTREQAWELIRALDAQDELMWHATVVDMFNGDEAGLYALEDANLIIIVHRDIGGSVIRIGKPVYRSAIRRLLTEDTAFTAYQDRMVSVKKLKKAEEEMTQKIGELVELAKLFPIIGSFGSNSNWSLGSASGKLPDEIRWKVEKVLKRLKVLESEVERLEGLVEDAKSRLKA